MLNYATVGASLLIKAMLWRQSLLTNRGQAGFIIICSTTIRSSLNKVLQDKRPDFRNIIAHQKNNTENQQNTTVQSWYLNRKVLIKHPQVQDRSDQIQGLVPYSWFLIPYS